MKFDIKKIPFSRRGSYFVISQTATDQKLYIRDLHGGDEAESNIYEIKFPEVQRNDLEILAEETILIIKDPKGNGTAKFTMGNNTLHILVSGIKIELHALGNKYDSLIRQQENQWEHILYSKERKIMCSCQYGNVKAGGNWNLIGTEDAVLACNGIEEETYLVLDNYRVVWKNRAYPKFQEVVEENQKEFQIWHNSFPFHTEAYQNQKDLAIYLLWVNFVKAEGILPYDALYCSKNWMYNMWSWDNCFMAIALSEHHWESSYEQISMFFDFQDESGCYPDYINDKFVSYSCCKPPIHAWAYQKMSEHNPHFLERERLSKAYESFCKVVNYWLNYRRKNKESLPEYNHGNDSGWDNASVFHDGVPVESPDLTAYLIRQIDILKNFATLLGKTEDVHQWEDEAEKLYQLLMDRLFDGKHFFPIYVPENKRIENGDSLLMYIPIIIGHRLPKSVLDQLVTDMELKFEKNYGLSTENPDSGYYRKGGYWLGPIWAPVTYIFIDALREHGYLNIAKRLANKFCESTKHGLMAENFDPFTGEGYDDPAFSWTSGVFLQLLKEFPDMEEN